jgi:hypothetical protein
MNTYDQFICDNCSRYVEPSLSHIHKDKWTMCMGCGKEYILKDGRWIPIVIERKMIKYKRICDIISKKEVKND